jgi:hypothetical protein
LLTLLQKRRLHCAGHYREANAGAREREDEGNGVSWIYDGIIYAGNSEVGEMEEQELMTATVAWRRAIWLTGRPTIKSIDRSMLWT